MKKIENFRQQLLNKEPLIGTFLKTPSSIVAEVLGKTELAAVCLDAEHAPFDRMSLDRCIHALRCEDTPALVRIPSAQPEYILNALDCGATGIVVPHVTSADQAEKIVKAAHYGPGGRGYAGSSRAASYTLKQRAQHIQDSARQTSVVVQIEDAEAVECIDEIASVEGVDCLFIGRVDLAVSYGVDSLNHARVIKAMEKICESAKSAGKTVGMFVADVNEVKIWRKAGASLFLLASDHAFLLSGAAGLVGQFTQNINS